MPHCGNACHLSDVYDFYLVLASFGPAVGPKGVRILWISEHF